MANLGSRRGFADQLSLPLMILAFLVVAGFLYWLSVTAEPTEIAIVEEEATRSSGASAILNMEDFLGDAGQYEGRVVEVTDARVASRLGSQAFWIGPDGTPFLVKMAPELVEAGSEVLIEQRVNLTGVVWVMTDSTHSAWDAQGAFLNEGDKIVAEFAIGSPYIEVTEIRAQTAAGGNAGAGGTD